jgi:hypothetical protein
MFENMARPLRVNLNDWQACPPSPVYPTTGKSVAPLGASESGPFPDSRTPAVAGAGFLRGPRSGDAPQHHIELPWVYAVGFHQRSNDGL